MSCRHRQARTRELPPFLSLNPVTKSYTAKQPDYLAAATNAANLQAIACMRFGEG